MIKLNLKQILRNRVGPRINKRYVKWRAEKKKNQLHHWLSSYLGAKKWNDYFLVDIEKKLHDDLEVGKQKQETEALYEIDFLVETFENLFDYIEELETKLNDRNTI